MNGALMRAFWRDRLRSPLRLVLLLAVSALPLYLALQHKPTSLLKANWTTLPVLVLGAGLIGRDLSTGVLQLIFARPVNRSEYLFSRWLALGLAAFAVSFVSWLIVLPFALNSGTTMIGSIGNLCEHLLAAFGIAAVLTGLSAVVSGFGDLALLLIGVIIALAFGFTGAAANHAWMMRVTEEILMTLFPVIDLKALQGGHAREFYPLAIWASAATSSLLMGIVALNRRELSYATSE